MNYSQLHVSQLSVFLQHVLSAVRTTVMTIFAILALPCFSASCAEFIPLGGFESEANGISENGSVVVGMNCAAVFCEPFRWTQETGMESIAGPLKGTDAYANDVSSDGSIVVGADFGGFLFRWFEDPPMELQDRHMELFDDNTAWDPSASADASVIVGRVWADGRIQATRWTEADGRRLIGPPKSGSVAFDISDDGMFVAGTTSRPLPDFPRPSRPPFLGEAFRWREEDQGFDFLGDLTGGESGSKAWAISPDGSAVVGVSTRSKWPEMEAFLWSEATDTMIGLGHIPGRQHSFARAVSEHAEVVVGYSADVNDPRDPNDDQAFIWDKVNDMRNLQAVLEEEHGLTDALAEWTLTRAHAITADGLHIAGRGINPLGDIEAWLVHLDPPVARLQAGDADQDLDFDQLDLVQVQIAAKYLSGQGATWGEGDWNGAPGGEQGSPPAGDGMFDQLDIVASLASGVYLTGPFAALVSNGSENDGQASIVYAAETGEVRVDAPTGVELTSINIDSAASIFTGESAQNLTGSFDNNADNNIFKATFGGSFGSLSLGNVAKSGLPEQFVLNDFSIVGSLQGGGGLGDVDLIYLPVPEPSAVVLLGLALTTIAWAAGARSLMQSGVTGRPLSPQRGLDIPAQGRAERYSREAPPWVSDGDTRLSPERAKQLG